MLGDDLAKYAVQPATIPAVQVLVQVTAAAPGARTPVLGIAVRLQRPAQGAYNVVVHRDGGLSQRRTNPDDRYRSDVGSRIIRATRSTNAATTAAGSSGAVTRQS
jgi:hypothetical protein